jgi:hypothetical protein
VAQGGKGKGKTARDIGEAAGHRERGNLRSSKKDLHERVILNSSEKIIPGTKSRRYTARARRTARSLS